MRRFYNMVSDRLQPLRSSVLKNSNNGFVTWVIRNKEYIAPALVLGSSLRTHSPGIPRVLLLDKSLVSNDQDPKLLTALRSVYTDVVLIRPFSIKTQHMKWTRFEAGYTPWIDYCFTRLYALNLKSILGLDKVLIMDVDTLVFRDISDIFTLQTPAGILSIPEGTQLNNKYQSYPGLDVQLRFKHGLAHAQPVPFSVLKHSVSAYWGIRGALMLLECNQDHYEKCLAFLKNYPKPYGRVDIYLGPDELFFSMDYPKLIAQEKNNVPLWTHIHQRYCCTAWHFQKELDTTTEWPLACHFVSQKPWVKSNDYWDDFDLWYAEAALLVSLNEELYSPYFHNTYLNKKMRRISRPIPIELHTLWDLAEEDSALELEKKSHEFDRVAQRGETRVGHVGQSGLFGQPGQGSRIGQSGQGNRIGQSGQSRQSGMAQRTTQGGPNLNHQSGQYQSFKNNTKWKGRKETQTRASTKNLSVARFSRDSTAADEDVDWRRRPQ